MLRVLVLQYVQMLLQNKTDFANNHTIYKYVRVLRVEWSSIGGSFRGPLLT